jgi:hypothetical protein
MAGVRHAPRLVQPDQIVVREVKRDRRLQVLQLLAEGVGEAGKTPLVLFVADREGREMMFTIEFFRIRKEDNAHATLARVTHIASDLEGARVKARSLFDVGTLNMPQNPDGLRILDEDGNEVFFWTPGTDDS